MDKEEAQRILYIAENHIERAEKFRQQVTAWVIPFARKYAKIVGRSDWDKFTQIDWDESSLSATNLNVYYMSDEGDYNRKIWIGFPVEYLTESMDELEEEMALNIKRMQEASRVSKMQELRKLQQELGLPAQELPNV